MSPRRERRDGDRRDAGDDRDHKPRRQADRRRLRRDRFAMGVALAILVVAVFYFQHNLRAQSHRLQDQNHRLAAVVTQIQTERERNTLAACLDSNERHDLTVAKIHQLTGGKEDVATRKFLELIDVQIPKRDCAKYVSRQVKGAKP